MGLLKKKAEDATGAEAVAEAAPAPEIAAEAPQPAVDLAQPAATPDGAVLAAESAADAPDAEADPALAEAAAAPEGAEPAADGSDALLNMFASSQTASDDRQLLVGMAGEVEVVDLVDQARTLAAAMNIVVAAD